MIRLKGVMQYFIFFNWELFFLGDMDYSKFLEDIENAQTQSWAKICMVFHVLTKVFSPQVTGN